MQCPLCQGVDTVPFFEDSRRPYLRCHTCLLVFVPAGHHLDAESEKRVYDQHQNDPADEGYRRFLSRLHEPMIAHLAPGAEGLDFGAGPGPTLSVMFEEAGFPMQLYDPFYAPQEGVFQRQYDFITATEVLEHLHRPGEEIARLWGCLRPGGLLGVMTKRVMDASTREAFAGWHYKNDPTHICFYAEATFAWLAGQLGAEVAFPADDVVLLFKTGQ